jgi:multimeric flavodoxin WrbA
VCFVHDDDVGGIYGEIARADGVIVGSPVYALDVTAKLKALMERGVPFCHYAASFVSGAIRNKVVGALAVAFERRGGQEATLASIWRWAVAVCGGVVVGATPYGPDHPPQGSFLGALADTCDSTNPLGDRGVTRHGSVTRPPTSGVLNMRGVRNLGRNVTYTAMIVKYGLASLEAAGHTLPPLALVSYPPDEIKEGSYLDRVRKGEILPPPYQVLRVQR